MHENTTILRMLESALEHHRAGRLDAAETIYRQILAVEPDNADSLHLLGMLEHQRGRHETAIEMIRQAIVRNPNQAAFHSNLGTILQAQGKLDEAAASFERALALKPDWAEVHSNLGNILQTQGRLEEAATRQQQALAIKPNLAEAWSNLGNVRDAQGLPSEAVSCYERALAIKPGYVDALNNLGAVLLAQDRIGEAMAQLEQALVLSPNYAPAHNNLGNALIQQDRIDGARAHYQRALALKPEYANAHNNLANALKQQGDFAEAIRHYDRAIELRPDYAEAHLNRADLKTFRQSDPGLAALEQLAARNDLPPDRAICIHFALAKALDDVGEYTRAFEHFRAGNELKRRQIQYDEPATLEMFQRISAAFDSSVFKGLDGQGEPSPAPVFVLGMPRSGSTLIEQILASHPQIQAAGELTIFETLEASGSFSNPNPQISYPESIHALDSAGLRRMGQEYVSRLPEIAPGKLRIVDKLPGNFLRIGLIHLTLPNAKIIHTTRHPADTCLSCYSKLFTKGLTFTYDLAELGHYYRAYVELMEHWRSVLPAGAMLDVSYEDVVNDLEGQARRLISYCGLTWDDRCMSFHQTGRRVKTASAVQVRQPLFRSSVQRWRNYEENLGPLFDALGYRAPSA